MASVQGVQGPIDANDLGPGAGTEGGRIVFEGAPAPTVLDCI